MVPLEDCRFFRTLTPVELERVKQSAKELHFKSGQHIFKEGDLGDGIYIVQEGLVQILSVVGPTDRRIFSRIGPGEMFGEMAVLDAEPRSATVSAEQDTTVYFIPRKELLEM